MSKLQPQQPITKEIYDLLGDSGTKRYAGYFMEEPQSEWRDSKRIENVETMRRTDAAVKQLLNVLKAPILASEEIIEPAGQDPKQIEHAQFIEKNIYNLKRTWKEFLREALTYFDFGFSVFELVWVKGKDGKIYLQDLAPRIQSSIFRWQLTDGRRGIIQRILTDESSVTEAQIPMNKLLVFTNDMEGDDLTGQSVLRPAWKHFYIKDVLYRISSIACERYGVGIPVITLPEAAGDAEKAQAEQMGAAIRSNEQSYIVKPSSGWEVEILTPSGNPQQGQIDSLIQHHDRMIVAAGLAAFLNLGSEGGGGSFALSQNQSGFFLKHVEDKAAYIAEQFNKQVIRRIIDLNFGPQEFYPSLKFTQIGQMDLSAMSSVYSTLVSAGLLEATPDIMQYVRKMFKLPEISDEELAAKASKELEAEMTDLEGGFDDSSDLGDELDGEIPEDDFPEDTETVDDSETPIED